MSRCRNFQGSFVKVTGGGANVETEIAHGLFGPDGRGIVPQGYMVVRRNSAASLYVPTIGSDITLTNDFIAGWEFENAGALGTDSYVNTLTLTNSGTTQVAGQVGFAAQCLAAGPQYLYRASEALLQTGDISFTFAAWLYLDSKGAFRFAIAKDNSAVGADREYALYYDSTLDRLRFAVFRAGPTLVVQSADALGSPALTTWYWVVGWHDAGADTVNIQVNNGTVNSSATGGALQAAGAAEFRIGDRQGSTSLPWNGRVDQVMFWKRTLTSDERTWLYNSGSGRTVAQVVAGESSSVTSWTTDNAYLASSIAGAQFYVIFFV